MRFRCISPKTILLRLSSSAFCGLQPPSQVISAVARFSTLSSFCGSAGSSSSVGCSSSRPFQQGVESRDVGVFVWWDFNDCKLPAGTDGFKVAPAITAAIRSSFIKGPITITAFGEVSKLSLTNRRALSSTGININHVEEEEISTKRVLRMDLMTWVLLNPPPAHIFVISSDKDLARTLHELRKRKYNTLLASKSYAPSALCSDVTIMWNWCSLLKGENVTGKHVNQTPDGSWYGQYKIILQDPSTVVVEQSNSVGTKEFPVVRTVSERVDKQRVGEK